MELFWWWEGHTTKYRGTCLRDAYRKMKAVRIKWILRFMWEGQKKTNLGAAAPIRSTSYVHDKTVYVRHQNLDSLSVLNSKYFQKPRLNVCSLHPRARRRFLCYYTKPSAHCLQLLRKPTTRVGPTVFIRPIIRDSRKSQPNGYKKHGNFCENRKNHGKITASINGC